MDDKQQQVDKMLKIQDPIGDHYLIQFFKWRHLPEHLQMVSRPFSVLADIICANLPDNPERTTALRKLLEAKDCAVRAKLFEEPK